MPSNLKSFSFAIVLHLFVVAFLFLIQTQKTNINSLDKNIKLIRLVTFGNGGGGNKNISMTRKNSNNNITKTNSSLLIPNSVNKINTGNTENLGSGSGTGSGASIASDVGGGISPAQASPLELEVNKLRVYLQKYLDQKLDSKNINFNIQITLNKSDGVTDIEILTDQLTSKQIYLIKRIVSSYQHQNLLSHLPSTSMKILIPIKIIEG